MKNKENKIRAAIVNLGCKVNKYEADAMKDKLIAAGIAVVEPEETADIYIVNTCAVTNMAQKKSRQMLRRAKKQNPKAVIVAVGCYVNAEHDALKTEEFVDIVVGNNCKSDIVSVILQYLAEKGILTEKRVACSVSANEEDTDISADMQIRTSKDYYMDINKTSVYEEMGSLEAAHLDHHRACIKIQDGCNQFCSYCIIPYTRGRARSRRPENILAEIKKLADDGVKEFVLTGIHISSYGLDFQKEHAASREEIADLGSLVAAIAAIDKVERIRLGSLEPRVITEEFISSLLQSDKVCPHFHLSLQSACNATLKRMNRKYTIEEFEEKCSLLRKYFDRPAITTDVIVGFPGETEEEFEVTVANLERLALYEIHVFKYSVRAGTVAETLPNQVPEGIKNMRSGILLKLTAEQKKAYEKLVEDLTETVLVEEMVDEKPDIPLMKLWNGEHTGEKPGEINYYTGHTTRYVKVLLESGEDLRNSVVTVIGKTQI